MFTLKILAPKTNAVSIKMFFIIAQVGWYLKNPKYPVWLLGSETHLTVVFSLVNIMYIFMKTSLNSLQLACCD